MLYKYAQINYIFLFIFFTISLIIAVVIFLISYFMAKQSGGVEKLSAYELVLSHLMMREHILILNFI